MANPTIEVLSRTGEKQARLSPLQMQSQITAVQDLVRVTHQQLVANQIDRDALSHKTSSREEDHRFDAFFFIPDINGVAKITSVGLPDSQGTGLFLDIDYRDDNGEIKKLVQIQTAKVSEAVDDKEALWLSAYTPKQLQQIAEIVTTLNPITSETYQSYFQEPKIPAGLEM